MDYTKFNTTQKTTDSNQTSSVFLLSLRIYLDSFTFVETLKENEKNTSVYGATMYLKLRTTNNI